MKDLIKKQEEAFEMMKQSNGVLFANEIEEIKNFISKVRKESIEFERKRLKEILPEKSKHQAVSEYYSGYNQCIDELANLLK